ncbi:hypothetical protein TNCV_2225791 [Trichonephila clavipes]|nr:hypothetical protein TNCV_2225791 [Trichonephila clavipes]
MKFNTHNDTDERFTDLKNKTIKRIQGVQRHKYWATSMRVGLSPTAIHAALRSGIELITHLMLSEADASTNPEQPTLNHVQE